MFKFSGSQRRLSAPVLFPRDPVARAVLRVNDDKGRPSDSGDRGALLRPQARFSEAREAGVQAPGPQPGCREAACVKSSSFPWRQRPGFLVQLFQQHRTLRGSTSWASCRKRHLSTAQRGKLLLDVLRYFLRNKGDRCRSQCPRSHDVEAKHAPAARRRNKPETQLRPHLEPHTWCF